MATIQKVSGIDFANISKFDGVDISAVGSINFIGKPATGNLLLDTSYGSGAEAAYSVRKLRTAYTGAAIQVQATTGGATAEIGFDVDNNLDTATLLAFAGTNEVGVSIWYDQSTNGNNATQISVAQRPIVVAAGGALVEDNGKMALDFDGSNDGFYSSGVSLTDSMDVFILSHKESTTRQAWFAFDAATNINYYRQEGGTVTPRIYASFNQGLFNFNFLSPNYQTQILNNLSGTNGAQEVFFDGVSVHTSNATFSNPGLSGLHLGIQSNGANEFNGKYQEFILYDTVKSSTNRTSIEENIGDYYTQNTPLLDTYSGAAAAYSLRKLRTDYTGFAIKVQDNVGGATQDIGFNVFGELDTVSLLQYAGSNDVFVVTWFDQSGGSLDMTPISSSNRGQIVVSGVVNTNSEGKVFIDMNPSQYPLGASIPQPYQIVTVWKANSDRRFLNGSGFDFNLQSDKLRFLIGSSIAGSTNINNAIINLATASVDSGAAIIRLNGNVEATGTISTSAIPSNSIVFSRLNNPSWGPEQSYEFIIFDSVQSDITGIESNINTFYDIYTPTPDPLLLNLYPGSAAAYSLRKLNANYTGSAILVQDTVGGATKAIGFDANGDLDTVELLAYAGSNDVLVATWFDQSGSGNDATQPSSSIRPQIVSSGAVIVDANGKPEVQFSALFSLDMATRLTQVQSNFSVRENITTGASVDFLYGDISTYDYHAGGTNNYLDTLYSSTDVRNGSNFVNGQSQSFTTANTATTSSVLLSMIHLSNTARISQICQDRSRSNRSWNGNMQEIILYENDQSAKLTDIEENIGGYYDIPLAGLLDENPGAAAAYSLRRLSSTYTGSAVQIQRADNVGGTTDIGFDSYGDLDTTALTTAAAGNSMVVTTWFDQSGSGNDATQGTSANRPKIYDATTGVVLENGKPAVDFDTFGMRLVAPNAASLQIIGDLFASVVTAGVNEIGHGPLFIKRTSDSQREYELRFNSATQMKYLDSFNNKNYAISSSANQRLFVLRRVADTSAELFENGLSISSQSLSGTAFTTTAGLSIGGREAGDYNLDGVLQEVILWPSQQTANRPSIEENIGGYYDIPLAGLLDENPGAAAAYSLRRLSSTYTGSAIQVQRADNVGGTTDIGFDSYGDLDTTALTTAAQGNDMVVTTWFDQSGSGNNATQGTSANRPKIYDGTTGVIVENGKPAVDFDGGTDTLTHSSDIALAACSIFTTLTAVAAIRVWYGETDQNYLATFSGNVTCTASTSQRNAVHTPSGQTLYNYTRNGSVGGTWYKNSSPLTTTGAQTNQTLTLNSIGGFSSYKHVGPIQEIILYNSDQSDNRPSIEDNVGDYYGIEIAGLLDQYSGAAAAYSLRKLSNSYTGSAVRVQRADNVGGTTDIGFNADGGLDTDALTTAAAGNTMVVTTWFDQSGSGNDATQGSSLLRPKIYDGTTGVIVENGKPALQSSNRQWLELTTRLTTIQSVFYTLTWDGNSGNAFDTAILGDISTLDYSGDGGAVNWFEPQYASNDVKNGSNFKNGSTSFNTKTANEQSLLSLFHLNATGKVSQIAKDRTFLTRGISGTKQEIILYTSDESAYRTDIESNINFFYDIY